MTIFLNKRGHCLICFFLLVGGNCSENKDSQNADNQIDSSSVHISHDQSLVFSIQIAALRDKNNADNLNNVLRKSELPAYVLSASTSSGDSLFKVRIGPYRTEYQAARALKNINTLGYEKAFITTDDLASVDSVESDLDEKSQKIQLTFSGECSHPQWSPQGREIAFFKKENGSEGLYTIGTGGGRISKIIESKEEKPVITAQFSWGPSGEKIAFTAIEVNKNWQQSENLFVINKNGSGLRRLIGQTGMAYKISDLKWSPDGRRIALNTNYGKRETWSDYFQTVKIVNLDEPDSYLTELAVVERINSVLGWKSNDELLFLAAYDDIDELGYEIWIYEVSTKNRKRLFSDPVVSEFHEIAYAAHESLLIYTSASADKIMTLDLESGQETLILETRVDPGEGISINHLSATNETYFLSNQSLLKFDRNYQLQMSPVEIIAESFTLSPFGNKICFAENGSLFTLKVSF